MLNKSKLLHELKRVSPELFKNVTDMISDALSLWRIIAHNTELSSLLHTNIKEITIPTWHGALKQQIIVDPNITDIHIIGVDGSQIYPDRHNGISCFLINIGIVALHYGTTINGARFDSYPQIYTITPDNTQFFSEDWVDGNRQEQELRIGIDAAIHMQQQLLESNISDSVVLLCDGSLIFWLLESKNQEFQKHFLTNYIALLEQLYLQNIAIAMYISVPHSRELVNILKATVKMINTTVYDDTFTHVYDSHLISDSLLPYHRSTVFASQVDITNCYPHFLKPHFFYLHVGREVARIEIPAYVAQDEQMVNYVASVVLSQSIKGHGYPIALAEAHEQAVIKHLDRDFFYKMIDSMYYEHNGTHGTSPKAIQKKHIAI